MRKFLMPVLLSAALIGCKSLPTPPPNAVRASADVMGKGVLHPVYIMGVAATPEYKIDGNAAVTFQWPEKPHLTVDGDATTTVTSVPGVGLSPAETPPENVLIRVPYPQMQIKDPVPATPAHPLPPAGGHNSGTCAPGAAGDCAPMPSSAPPPAPTATPPASANGRISASKFCGQAAPAAAPAASAENNACAMPKVAAASARKCGDPVYVSPAKRDCTAAEGYDRAAMGRGLRPGQVGLSPFEDCSLPKAADDGCARGIPAIVQGLLDLFSGKAF